MARTSQSRGSSPGVPTSGQNTSEHVQLSGNGCTLTTRTISTQPHKALVCCSALGVTLIWAPPGPGPCGQLLGPPDPASLQVSVHTQPASAAAASASAKPRLSSSTDPLCRAPSPAQPSCALLKTVCEVKGKQSYAGWGRRRNSYFSASLLRVWTSSKDSFSTPLFKVLLGPEASFLLGNVRQHIFILYYFILYYIILYYIILYCIVLYCIILFYFILFYFISLYCVLGCAGWLAGSQFPNQGLNPGQDS